MSIIQDDLYKLGQAIQANNYTEIQKCINTLKNDNLDLPFVEIEMFDYLFPKDMRLVLDPKIYHLFFTNTSLELINRFVNERLYSLKMDLTTMILALTMTNLAGIIINKATLNKLRARIDFYDKNGHEDVCDCPYFPFTSIYCYKNTLLSLNKYCKVHVNGNFEIVPKDSIYKIPCI
jgi:hypothetical protein